MFNVMEAIECRRLRPARYGNLDIKGLTSGMLSCIATCGYE